MLAENVEPTMLNGADKIAVVGQTNHVTLTPVMRDSSFFRDRGCYVCIGYHYQSYTNDADDSEREREREGERERKTTIKMSSSSTRHVFTPT
jgi:hypothetical protein